MPKLFITAIIKYFRSKRFLIFYLLSIFIFFHLSLDGQVSVTATAGNMGPTPYTTLKDAFDAVNAGTHQGSITIVISGDTNESASAVLNGSGSGSSSYSSILIQPGGGAARTISGAIVAGSPLIDLNGADYITIDGLNTAGNSLIISNTTASAATGTSTIRFQTDATNNTITRCSILGSSNSTSGISGGNIWIGAAGITTGNDDNTISFCNIGPAGTNLPSKCIYLWGTSNSDPGTSNSGIVITNNNIFDFFSTSVVSTGIDINFGATGTLISNNKFYQTATRIQTGTAGNRAIRISNAQGNNYQIIGNTIGFANNMGTGKYTIDFQNSGSFNGISFSVGITTATSVQGNIIAGISISGGISGTFSTAPVVGIFHSAGLATIGDVTGNTIGSQSETSSITVTSSSSSAADVIGIGYFGIKDWTTDNNTIGGITASNTSTGAANIYGIVYLASNASWSCLNNIVGGSISNSIQSNTLSTGSRVQGIRASTTPSIISGNTIQNLSAAGGTGTTINASVIGICVTQSNANHTIAQNTIHHLSNSNASDATNITGIEFTGSTGTNIVERNFIYSLNSATSNSTAEINGIRVAGGTATYRNNMIAIGAEISNACMVSGINEPFGTNNFFHNNVYIGGAPNAGNSNSFAFNSIVVNNSRSYIDNIFVNARSNNGATGKNYAIRVGGTSANPPGLTINNDLYYTNGAGTVFGLFNGADITDLASWQSAVGQDAASLQGDPQYLDPTNTIPNIHLHPSLPTPAEGNGQDVGVTFDFDGQVRSGLTPVDIGADAGNFIAIGGATQVTNTNDNGQGSLREVISTASNGATITFSPVLMDQTITLTSGEIDINKNLILSGLGMMNLTISGNNTSRIFHLFPGKIFNLENLALKNAAAMTNGGALLVEGNLILENMILQHNFENGMPKSLTLIGISVLEIVGNVNIMY